jgi:hypothetical protein
MGSSIELAGETWHFIPNEKCYAPSLPEFYHGCLVKPKSNSETIYILVDDSGDIWMGFKKEIIIMDHFETKLAMDTIYNYNILAWVNFVEELPEEMYQKILKSI